MAVDAVDVQVQDIVLVNISSAFACIQEVQDVRIWRKLFGDYSCP